MARKIYPKVGQMFQLTKAVSLQIQHPDKNFDYESYQVRKTFDKGTIFIVENTKGGPAKNPKSKFVMVDTVSGHFVLCEKGYWGCYPFEEILR